MDIKKLIDFRIPNTVKLEVKKGLDRRKRDKRGVHQPAISAGDYLLTKEFISPAQVHKFSDVLKTLSPDATPAHYTTYLLYGGNAGRDWVKGLVASIERVQERFAPALLSEPEVVKDYELKSVDPAVEDGSLLNTAATVEFDSVIPDSVKQAELWMEIAGAHYSANDNKDIYSPIFIAGVTTEYRQRGGEFKDLARRWVDLSRKSADGNFETVFFPDTMSDDEVRAKNPTCVRLEIAKGLTAAEIEAFKSRKQASKKSQARPEMPTTTYKENMSNNAANGQIFAYQGDAIKDLGAGQIGGYLVRFSDSTSPDLTGDYFTKNTDFGLDMTTKSAVLYAHGFSSTLGKKRIGTGNLEVTEDGVYIKAQLNLTSAAEQTIYQAVQRGDLGWSSGTASHLVTTRQVGGAREILTWPLGLDASLTNNPAEPRNRATTIKSVSADEFVDPLEFAFKNADRNPDQHQTSINQLLELVVALGPSNLKQFNLANAALEVPEGLVDESVVEQYRAENRVLRTDIIGYQEQIKAMEAVQADNLTLKSENEALRERLQMLKDMQDIEDFNPAGETAEQEN